MDIQKIILNRRSIRRFTNKKIGYKLLKRFIDAGRLAPSGGNLQPWEFIIADSQKLLDNIFDTLKWANYLEGGAPPRNNRPAAYIIILKNKEIRGEGGEYDIGMAAENIMLSAAVEGIGTCCIGTVDKNRLRSILNVPKKCEIKLVIALGYPDEESTVEGMADGSIKYWRDEKGKMHVPKRDIRKILHRDYYKNEQDKDRK